MIGNEEGLALPVADNRIPPRGPASADGADAPLSAAEHEAWSALIAGRLGLHFPPARSGFLRDRLWRRVRHHGLRGLGHYQAFLASNPQEWDALADLLTVNETRFCRDQGLYGVLRERIVPELARRREQGPGPRRMMLWSAGCSTGDEAYTLAMTALESVPLPMLWDLRVLGTDLSPRNIAQARAGVYPAARLAALPAEWLSRYTIALGRAAATEPEARYQVREKVRALTTFRVHNLCDDFWGVPAQDVIVCQNVLIYFRRQEQLRVLRRLYDTLQPGGYLLVGATELPLEPLRPGLKPRRMGDTLVYQREGGG